MLDTLSSTSLLVVMEIIGPIVLAAALIYAGPDAAVSPTVQEGYAVLRGLIVRIAQAGNIVIADTAGGPIDVGYAKGKVTPPPAASRTWAACT
jgi:hypothetical protein